MSARTDEEAAQVQASSGITPESLSTTLKSKLEASHVDISDLSGTLTTNSPRPVSYVLTYILAGGCGQMFEAVIVSPQFAKKTTLARHRLVNNTLKQEIAAIHAWTPKCFTPEEWEKKRGTS
jgi:stress-induced morphogen